MSHFEQDGHPARRAAARGLREVVARRQITMTALSRATGIPRSTLASKLRGDGDLTVAELVRLAIALDVPAAELLEVDGETTRADRTGDQH